MVMGLKTKINKLRLEQADRKTNLIRLIKKLRDDRLYPASHIDIMEKMIMVGVYSSDDPEHPVRVSEFIDYLNKQRKRKTSNAVVEEFVIILVDHIEGADNLRKQEKWYRMLIAIIGITFMFVVVGIGGHYFNEWIQLSPETDIGIQSWDDTNTTKTEGWSWDQ